MRARIVRIGNSHGIRVPRPLLEQVGAAPDSEVELEARHGRLVITPVRRPRREWTEAFARGRGNEEVLDGTVETRFDREEWSW
jgi:antitoxin MazE